MKHLTASTFGATLKMLLDKNHMTPGALGRTIGDTTSVRRAINEMLSARLRQKVFDAIYAHSAFPDDELEMLYESLEVSRLGKAKFLYFSALDTWMGSAGFWPERTGLPPQSNELATALNRFDSAGELSILCINCLFKPVMEQFRRLLQNPDRPVNIRHYLTPVPPEGSISAYLSLAGELIFDLRYHALIPQNQKEVSPPLPLYSNLIAIRGTVQSEPHEVILTVVSGDEIYPFPGRDILGAYDYFLRIIERAPAPRQLLIRPAERTDFSSTCLELLGYEMGRKTIILSPGLRNAVMPPAVFRAALRSDASLTSDMLNRMISLHTKRFQYSISTRKPRVLITSLCGIQQFLKNGKTQDHPPVLRALEPDERLSLLDVILRHAAGNQKLSFRLLKAGSPQPPCQLCCHNQLAVTFHYASHPNRMTAPYVTLLSESFADEMSDYLTEVVMETCCLPASESLARLKQLRDEYAAAIGR